MKKLFILVCMFIAVKQMQAQWNLTGNAGTGTSFLGTTNNFSLRLRTNNLNRMVIDSNGRVGIGTTAPRQLLTVQSSGTAPAASWISSGAPVFAGYGEGTAGNADFNLLMASSTAANARGVFGLKRSRGTLAVPAAVTNNDQLGSLLVSGFDGSNFQGSAAIDFFADGTPSAGNVPARISFVTGTNGGNRTERLRIGNTGNVSINSNQLFVQQSTGNVGIGTTTPTAKLQVAGDAFINNLTIGVGGGNISTNNALGAGALNSNTTGYSNTATGYNALFFNSSGNNNTANGYFSLFANSTGNDNTATGSAALISNTSGNGNTANGTGSLYTNTMGTLNTATGSNAMYYNSTGNYNTATGVKALYNNTGGVSNTATGFNALYSNTLGSTNTACGLNAMYSNTLGNGNIALGSSALYASTLGNYNTGVGYNALSSQSDGDYNTALGGFCYPPISSSINWTGIGYNVGNGGSGNNMVEIGNSSVSVIRGQVGFTTYSDQRIKNNIKQDVPGLAFINQLKPVTYNLDIHKENEMMYGKAKSDTINWPGKYDIEKIRMTGFLAQEVEGAAKSINYDFSGVVTPQNDKDLYSLRYSEFVVPLVKAVQELSKKNDELGMMNEQLKIDNGQLKVNDASLQKQIDELRAMIQGNSKHLANINQQSVSFSEAALEQNIPNPPTGNFTRINYNIPTGATHAEMMIVDNAGRKIKTISLSTFGKGVLNVDTKGLATGTYSYTMMVDGMVIDTKQMVVVK